jgi:NTE family protein
MDIEIALSGSGFKFPALVGGLTAAVKHGYRPTNISCTSGGSIIGSLFASGMSIDELKSLALGTNWSDMLTFSPMTFLRGKGYCNGKTLYNWLRKYTYEKTFADLDIGLTIMASDITNERPFEFSKDTTPNVPIALAVRASASIPFVYAPVDFQGCKLMDGGLVNNIAVDKLSPKKKKLGIYLVSKTKKLQETDMLHEMSNMVDLILTANENLHVQIGETYGAKVAFIETGFAHSLDRNMTFATRSRLFTNGYLSVTDTLKIL